MRGAKGPSLGVLSWLMALID